MKKIFNMIIGTTLASLGIACILNSNLGCFSITACYKALSDLFNIPLAIANALIEVLMICYAIHKGEGLGLTAIFNATYGALMINLFHSILPCTKILGFGGFLLPIGWCLMGKAGMGDTGTNILTRALMKSTGKHLSLIRIFIDGIFLIIAYIGAPQYVTWFTLLITFGCGPLLQLAYKLMGYEPIKIKHKFLINKR